MSNEAEVRQALGQLVEALRDSRGWRITARPGRVVVDHAEGPRALELAWTADNQTAALSALGDGATIVDGLAAMAVGDAVLVVRGPDANRRLEDVARDGVISGLAGRLIEAAVALGRNVIVAGPWLASVDLIGAIVAGGTRPAILEGGQIPLPATWVRVSGHLELATYGADRVGTWSTGVDALAKLMAGTSGVVGWVDARRLDRVLVRYEAAVDPGAQTPLHVVAGVDLVVVLQGVGGAKVREIAEITMAADGYRPQLLFATGMPPSPQALVPLASPTFIDELAAHGFGVLADELKAIAPLQRTVPDDFAHTVDRARQIATQVDLPDIDALPEPRRRPVPSGRQHDPLGIREALVATARPRRHADLLMSRTQRFHPLLWKRFPSTRRRPAGSSIGSPPKIGSTTTALPATLRTPRWLRPSGWRRRRVRWDSRARP